MVFWKSNQGLKHCLIFLGSDCAWSLSKDKSTMESTCSSSPNTLSHCIQDSETSTVPVLSCVQQLLAISRQRANAAFYAWFSICVEQPWWKNTWVKMNIFKQSSVFAKMSLSFGTPNIYVIVKRKYFCSGDFVTQAHLFRMIGAQKIPLSYIWEVLIMYWTCTRQIKDSCLKVLAF